MMAKKYKGAEISNADHFHYLKGNGSTDSDHSTAEYNQQASSSYDASRHNHIYNAHESFSWTLRNFSFRSSFTFFNSIERGFRRSRSVDLRPSTSLPLQSIEHKPPEPIAAIEMNHDKKIRKRRTQIRLTVVVLVLVALVVAASVTLSTRSSSDESPDDDFTGEDVSFTCDEDERSTVLNLTTSSPLVSDIEFPAFDAVTISEQVICLPERAFAERTDQSLIGLLRFQSNDIQGMEVGAFEADELFNVFLISIEDSPSLSILPQGIFDALPSLFELRLKNVNVGELSNRLFENNQLGNLFIENSGAFVNMPDFIGMEKLEFVGFQNCANFEFIPDNAFSNLDKLVHLDVTGTKIAQNDCQASFRARTNLSANVNLFGFSC